VNLVDVARDLAELPRQAIIYVPRDELVVSKSTPALLVLAEDESPASWRYLLEVLIAREVLEVWSAWRDGRIPSVEEACEAIIYYADNDAYQPES
jgi:hypothetical protein